MNEYTSNKVFSESERLYLPWQSWLWAIIWNAVVWYAMTKVGDKLLQALDQDPIFYFIVLFPVIGLWLVIAAIKTTRSAYKFGKSAVVLAPFPAQVGGQCAGYLDLPLAIKKSTQATINLTCVRQSYHHKSRSNSIHNTIDNNSRAEPLWQDRSTVAIQHIGQNSRIAFAFEPPEGLPASDDKSKIHHFWKLHIKIPMTGIDYDRVFEIPVIVADETMQASHQRYTHQTNANSSVDADSVLIPNISKTPAGMQLTYGYGRSKLISLMLIVFATAIALMDYFILTDFIGFLPITSTLLTFVMGFIALALFLMGILFIASNMTIEAGLDGISKQQRIIGFTLKEMINASEIVEIIVEKESSRTVGHETHVWFKLQAIKQDGSKVEVGNTLLGHSHAEKIKQQMLTALGLSWLPASLNNQQPNKPPRYIWLKRVWQGIFISITATLLYDLIQAFPQVMDFINKIVA